MRATCISCGRTYWATEECIRLVKEGKEESLCKFCSPEVAEEEVEYNEED